jgi:hypothetical protein
VGGQLGLADRLGKGWSFLKKVLFLNWSKVLTPTIQWRGQISKLKYFNSDCRFIKLLKSCFLKLLFFLYFDVKAIKIAKTKCPKSRWIQIFLTYPYL